MTEIAEPTSIQYQQATTYAREALKSTVGLTDIWGYTQGVVSPGYAEWSLAQAYAYHLASGGKLPFHDECGEGHDPAKISCDEVAEMAEADRAIYPG